MREETNEIADSKISIHDKHRFEIKLDIELSSRKTSEYRVATYFFIPKALNISPNTYSKEQFYNSAQKYIRFKTPQISLSKIIDPSVEISPFNRIRHNLPLLLEGNRDTKTIDTVFNEIKLLGVVSRVAIRDFVKLLLDEMTQLRKCDYAAPRLEHFENVTLTFIREINAYVSAIHALKAEILNPNIPVRLREAFSFFDEFISLTIEDFLTALLQGIRDNPGPGKKPEAIRRLDAAFCELIVAQQVYRRSMGYPSVAESGARNSILLYRRGILKKFISSILFLSMEMTEWEGWTQIPVAVAAGFAMLFAATVTIFAQNKYTTNSSAFIVIVVISYIFKDRLKDWLKLFFSKSMVRWIADRKIKIRDPFSGQIIGYFKEVFSFVEDSKVPAEVRYRRNMDNITSIDEEGKPERVIKYEKEVFLFSNRISRFHERLRNINDIMRLNIKDFLIQADDPLVDHLLLDPVANELKPLPCERVYHVNMVIKYQSIDGGHHASERYERMRLVVNRDGIQNLEEVRIK